MSVAVVVPWRGGCPHRETAWEWVRARYAERHPDWHLLRAELPPGPWIKATAVMPVVAECSAEVVAVADADAWCEGLADAVANVYGGTSWAIPHRPVHRLTEASTDALIAGADPADLDVTQRPYLGIAGGGFVVARRETLLDVPLDPRFVGWGQEDECWGIALWRLAGKPWRGGEPLWHLWHPPQERLNRRHGSFEAKRLRRRYYAARRSTALMRALLDEVSHRGPELRPDKSPLHDHPAHSV